LGRIRRRDRRDGISQRRGDYCGPAKADDVGYSIQQHLGEEVEGLDLSMDSVSNATQPGQLLGVLGRYSYRLAGVRPALGVNPG